MNKREKINVCFTIDNNYTTHCAVSMASILKNTKKDICFHIISKGLSDKNKNKLSNLSFNYDIKFYEVKEELLEMPLNREHISIAAYYLLLLSYFIVEDKVIFLDADTIVLDDIYNLWKIDVSDVSIAAVIDESNICHEKRLKLKGYFNSGVLLLNMIKYRQKTLAQYIDILKTYNEDIICQDQDLLNIAFKEDVKYLDLRWNTNTLLYTPNTYADTSITLRESYRAKSNPAILHYTGFSKPWQFTNCHPEKLKYLKYLCYTKCYKDLLKQLLFLFLSIFIKIDVYYKETYFKVLGYPVFLYYNNKFSHKKYIKLFNLLKLEIQ